MKPDTSAVLLRFRRHLEGHCRLGDASWELLEGILEIKTLPRHGLLLEEGKTCRAIDFIDSGALRRYHLQDGRETSTGLYAAPAFVTDMKSLTKETASSVFIQALEATVIVRLHKSELVGLYARSAELQAAGRAILEAMLVAESEWKEMYTLYDPKQRYTFLQQKAPELLQRVPLQHIASFLGMRRETLSRIRSRR